MSWATVEAAALGLRLQINQEEWCVVLTAEEFVLRIEGDNDRIASEAAAKLNVL